MHRPDLSPSERATLASAIEALGGTIATYVPDNTLCVVGAADFQREAAQLAGVVWVGAHAPEHKFAEEDWEALRRASEAVAVLNCTHSPGEFCRRRQEELIEDLPAVVDALPGSSEPCVELEVQFAPLGRSWDE
ncbi:hypothetical protein H632_c1899p0, partial [Helicosporidium sp. ATCC 50920]